jgi:1,4-dihydroxy-2-naphthoyl-CoA hydrolase
MIWKTPPSMQHLNAIHENTAVAQLGIEFISATDDSITARMPVDERTKQPIGLLHGGASVLLAETLGSSAANCCVDTNTHYCVGLEINANHIRGARSGWVTGTTTALHIGSTTHVWEIKIRDDAGKLTCVSRITMAVIKREK